ncbi:MAG: sugar phosphate isomerase/epimerase [Lachnospiraceae bacterium]|nr:sugar phosphate isomerase/epimerase [Lachnospiraceae bacterium]
MKFGNAAWGFRQMPLEEQLKFTRKMGFEVLELGIANAPGDLPLTVEEKELEQVKNLFFQYGVRLDYASTGNDFSEGNQRDLEKVRRVCDICGRLGVKYLRIFSGFSPVKEVVGDRWETMISSLREADAYAGKRNVHLVIETHGGVRTFRDGVEHFMSTSSHPETLARMLKELPETVRVCYDPANLWAVGLQKPEEVYEICRDRVSMVHLKEFVPLASGHLRPAACGDGEMNWRGILEALKDYEGAALFEYENPWDVREGTARCYDYIKKRTTD